MKMSFVLNSDYAQKRESGFCFENATMIQIQDMFENGKPDIVKAFNIKKKLLL